MSIIIDIGLPDISEDTIEQLAEECEVQVMDFIKSQVPEKSLDTLFITCALNLQDGQLDINIDIDISQVFDTGHDLNDLLQEAVNCGAEWLEKKLMEMKGK
jgi:cell division protein ZapA (FtsZ GTPase activity inhibitor)